MRFALVLLTGWVLAQSSIARADFDQAFDESDFASEAEAADVADAVAARVAGWNQWTCTALSVGFPVRSFRGLSYYFREGSGEGQDAKRVAQKFAQRNCAFGGGRGCLSDLAKCTVTRH